MIADNLTDAVLFRPLSLDVNRLLILTGYATPNMASWYIKNIAGRTDKSIDMSVLVGMVPYDGLSVAVHDGFKELMHEPLPHEMSGFRCNYIYESPPINSKLYIWAKDDIPIAAYTGSADFIQSAFSRNRREIMTECDPNDAFDYYNKAESHSIVCNHSEIEDNIILHTTHPILDKENRLLGNISGAGIKSVTLSLLSSSGSTGTKSGINWGQRSGRNPNQAYISLPAVIARSGFFPLHEQHFTVLTDDGHQLILRVEQQNNKAITTPLSNAQLGEYLRYRLGTADGAYVEKADLERYGRTDITFYKLDEEQYYMDFSV